MSAGDSNPNPADQSGAAEELHDAIAPPRDWGDEAPDPKQIEIYRRMTPGRRLELAEQLYWTGRGMKAAWLQAQHPEWTEDQVAKEVTRIFSHARS